MARHAADGARAGGGRARPRPLRRGALAVRGAHLFRDHGRAAARRLAALGARFVVSVNNDVWFGDREAPHVVWARIRAVESGLPVVRASNRGTTGVIDPLGRWVAARRATEAPGFLAAAVPAPAGSTYDRTGEVFLPACLVVAVAGLVPIRRSWT